MAHPRTLKIAKVADFWEVRIKRIRIATIQRTSGEEFLLTPDPASPISTTLKTRTMKEMREAITNAIPKPTYMEWVELEANHD